MKKNMTLVERMNEEIFEEEIFEEEMDFVEKSRRRGIRRKKDVAKALRKKRINKETRDPEEKPWYNNLHQYSKNKIHCSCPLCRFNGIPHSDQKKIDGMNARYRDFCMGAQEELGCPDIAL